jgi:beta-glucosidase
VIAQLAGNLTQVGRAPGAGGDRGSSDTVDVSGSAELSLTITNTGERGTEVVRLYAADSATGVTLPAQQLVGFARVDLEPAATKTVEFTVPMSVLAYPGISGDLVMEPGPVEVSAGSSSSDVRSSATFTVTGQTRVISGDERAFFSDVTVEPPVRQAKRARCRD